MHHKTNKKNHQRYNPPIKLVIQTEQLLVLFTLCFSSCVPLLKQSLLPGMPVCASVHPLIYPCIHAFIYSAAVTEYLLCARIWAVRVYSQHLLNAPVSR